MFCCSNCLARLGYAELVKTEGDFLVRLGNSLFRHRNYKCQLGELLLDFSFFARIFYRGIAVVLLEMCQIACPASD